MSGNEQQRARTTALDLLARREHSRRELQAKLELRGYPAEIIEPLLDQLMATDLLSEGRFAESFVTARARKGQGPRRLRAELKQRGLDDVMIEQALADAGIDWTALAGEVRCKKFGDTAPVDIKERARQMRFLEYRGFAADDIRVALSETGRRDRFA